MLRELKYGGLTGKTRAMFGNLLRSVDYAELIQKKSISEVVSYLKHDTHYKGILSDIDENDIHRGKLENILRRDLINDYTKLLKFTDGNLKKFVNLLFIKAEIENLKLIFRIFEAGHVGQLDPDDVSLFNNGPHNVNIPKLALSRNLEEFLAGLKGSVYYDVLRPYASENNETRLFSMEMALDLFYLRNLQNCYSRLMDKKDCEIINKVIGLESDIFNIFWVYRSKTFYEIDAEVIRSYTLPLIYKLRKDTLDALVKAKNFEEFVDILKGTVYGFLFEGKNQLFYEHSYSEFIYKMYRKLFRDETFTIASVIAYIRMKEVELSNIISIIEGIRYKLPEENIRRFIIGMSF